METLLKRLVQCVIRACPRTADVLLGPVLGRPMCY